MGLFGYTWEGKIHDESDWSKCINSKLMFAYMNCNLQSRLTDRKSRLLACACCRRISKLLTDERSLRAVEVAERFADGQATEAERTAVRKAATECATEFVDLGLYGCPESHAATAAESSICMAGVDYAYDKWAGRTLSPSPQIFGTPLYNAAGSSRCSVRAVREEALTLNWRLERNRPIWERAWKQTKRAILGNADRQELYFGASISESSEHCILIRDILGSPFRSIQIDASFRTRDAAALAQRMYEDRDFANMPILGDALEEAGCTDENILNHCRCKLAHARGCWVVDAVLSRK